MAFRSYQVIAMSTDPRPFLSEVRHIVAAAEHEARDLTLRECEQCDRLLDAAEALARLKNVNLVGSLHVQVNAG